MGQFFSGVCFKCNGVFPNVVVDGSGATLFRDSLIEETFDSEAFFIEIRGAGRDVIDNGGCRKGIAFGVCFDGIALLLSDGQLGFTIVDQAFVNGFEHADCFEEWREIFLGNVAGVLHEIELVVPVGEAFVIRCTDTFEDVSIEVSVTHGCDVEVLMELPEGKKFGTMVTIEFVIGLAVRSALTEPLFTGN